VVFAFSAFSVFVVSDTVSHSQGAFVVFGVKALSTSVTNAISLPDTALDVGDGTGECCDVNTFFVFVKGVTQGAFAAGRKSFVGLAAFDILGFNADMVGILNFIGSTCG
jgi:hypothetical protein